MNQINKHKTITFIVFSLIAVTFIMISWFKSGTIISNSEEALSIYNPTRTAQSNNTVWYPIGIGAYSPFGFNRAYVFTLFSYLADLGIPAYLNQALLIGGVMLLTLVCTYILFNYLSSGSYLISFFGSFFYLLNLYTQAQVFRRFLYNFMLALAYYPLFIFLFLKLLETKKWKYLLFLIGSSLIFSFSFNSPATIFPFLVSAVFIVIIKIWRVRTLPKEITATIVLSIITGLLWVVVNFWWLYPITKGSSDYVSTLPTQLVSDNANFESLEAVSKSFPISQILLLRQSWWYGEGQHWYEYYKQPFIYLLSISALLITILGLIRSRRLPHWSLLVGFLIIGLFISKGTNPPFGHTFFDILFNHFFYSAALRNPYEKFGLVFLLPFSFCLAYGLSYLLGKTKKDLHNLVIGLFAILFLVVLVWPMWSGGVFTKGELVKVPLYYSEANDLLNQRPDLRLFQIPMTRYYGERYDWGYYGQDPSENLFDRSSLSNTLTLSLYEMFYKDLPQLSKDKQFPKLLGFLGTGDIVVHHDAINKTADNLVDVGTINNWDGITKSKEFGKLTIYQLNPEIIRSRFYIIPVDQPDIKSFTGRIFPSSSVLEDNFINVSYKKNSSTHFNVSIQNQQKPFILVMNDTFDRSWNAQIDSQIIPNHFKAYGLVNGWLIKKAGNITVEIKFKVWPWD